MGFPLSKGDVKDGVLDCHWHHARFDVTCGATLDPWADDVERYDVIVKDGAVFVDPRRPPRDARAHGLSRLARGLDDDLRLVVAKSVIALDADVADRGGSPRRVDSSVLQREGWQPGLSILAAMANVLPDRREGPPPRADARSSTSPTTARGSRRGVRCRARRKPRGLNSALVPQTIDVRDAQGAERVLATIAVEHGAGCPRRRPAAATATATCTSVIRPTTPSSAPNGRPRRRRRRPLSTSLVPASGRAAWRRRPRGGVRRRRVIVESAAATCGAVHAWTGARPPTKTRSSI
jgi:hypothetical protein